MNEIQCWDGDSVEPEHVKKERLARERKHEQKVERVTVRLAHRTARAKHAKIRQRTNPTICCERFEMRSVGNRTHFHIRSAEDPRSLVFFAGDCFKQMVFRYPARDDIRFPLRMPVVWRAVGAVVIQAHAVEAFRTEEEGLPSLLHEVSITIEYDKLINDSQKVYKAFRDSICLPIPTLKGKHVAVPPGKVASPKDRAGQDLPQRPRQHRRKGLVREG